MNERRRRLQEMVWRGWPVMLFVAAISIFDFRYHEFWRDEAGAMLEARAVPWSSFLHAMRLEGIPPLFHVLLKIVGWFLPNHWALIVVGAFDLGVLLWGTNRLLVAISNSPRASARVTMAFAGTYVFAYELGVVIRQYTLGLGLAFAAWTYLRNALRSGQRHDVRMGTIFAGLSALTSAHSACVAGGALLSFGCLSLLRRRPWQSWSAILWTLPCFVLDAYLAAPFMERTPEANVVQHVPQGTTLILALQAIVSGIMPSDWWMLESFVAPAFQSTVAMLRSFAFWGCLVAAFLVFAARFASRGIRSRSDQFDIVAIVSSWCPLLVVIIHHYWGFYRHHLFLGLPALVVISGHAIDDRVRGHWIGTIRQTGCLLLVPWFALQYFLAIGCFFLDYRYPFSGTKDASRLLAEGAHVVTDTDWRTSGLVFWRPDLTLRSPSWNGRAFRYTSPDRSWHSHAPLLPILAEECSAEPNRSYFAGEPTSLGPLLPCANKLPYPKSPFETQPSTWEIFDILQLNCQCVKDSLAKPRSPRPKR